MSARAPPLDLEVWTAAGPDDDDVYCRAVMDFAMDTIGLAPAEAAQLVALYRVLRLVLGSSIAASDLTALGRAWNHGEGREVAQLMTAATDGQVSMPTAEAFVSRALDAIGGIFSRSMANSEVAGDGVSEALGGSELDEGGSEEAKGVEGDGGSGSDNTFDWGDVCPQTDDLLPLDANVARLEFVGRLAEWLVQLVVSTGPNMANDLTFEVMVAHHAPCHWLLQNSRLGVWLRALLPTSDALRAAYKPSPSLVTSAPSTGCDAQSSQVLSMFSLAPGSGQATFVSYVADSVDKALARAGSGCELEWNVLHQNAFPHSVQQFVRAVNTCPHTTKLLLCAHPVQLYVWDSSSPVPLAWCDLTGCCGCCQVRGTDGVAQRTRRRRPCGESDHHQHAEGGASP